MSIVYLRVKIKSLAAEAGIIRREEARYPRGQRNHPVSEGLRHHRRMDVRTEARAALLAYGYLRGRCYLQMEKKSYTPPPIMRVRDLVQRYGQGRNLPHTDKNFMHTALCAWVTEPGQRLLRNNVQHTK